MKGYTFRIKKGELEIEISSTDTEFIKEEMMKWRNELFKLKKPSAGPLETPAVLPAENAPAEAPAAQEPLGIPEEASAEEICEEAQQEPVEEIPQEPAEEEILPVKETCQSGEFEEMPAVEAPEQTPEVVEQIAAHTHSEILRDIYPDEYDGAAEAFSHKEPALGAFVEQEDEILDETQILAKFVQRKSKSLFDSFIICAFFVKHNLGFEGFTMKYLNAKMAQIGLDGADNDILNEALSREYVERCKGNEILYTITDEGENYLKTL